MGSQLICVAAFDGVIRLEAREIDAGCVLFGNADFLPASRLERPEPMLESARASALELSCSDTATISTRQALLEQTTQTSHAPWLV